MTERAYDHDERRVRYELDQQRLEALGDPAHPPQYRVRPGVVDAGFVRRYWEHFSSGSLRQILAEKSAQAPELASEVRSIIEGILAERKEG